MHEIFTDSDNDEILDDEDLLESKEDCYTGFIEAISEQKNK